MELVQHHHAHVASVMAEHGVPQGREVIGFAFDGTGFGPDGAIWGGEVMVASYRAFDRADHLAYVLLPGGDAAVRHPARVALAHLRAAGIPWDQGLPPVQALAPEARQVLGRQLERTVQCVPTSSMGRLFDGVSSLVGLRHTVTFEAQAAMELEAVAASHCGPCPAYAFGMGDGPVDPAPVIRAIAGDVAAGRPVGAMALGFHRAVADMVGRVAERLAGATGIGQVALSGGVFQNTLLAGLARDRLVSAGFEVLTHRKVPPNDGGLALGQAVVAGCRELGP